MRHLFLMLAILLPGCAQAPRAMPLTSPGFAVRITGYDVPRPAMIPFTDEVAQREFLCFYHSAYLATMWADLPYYSTISPMSDHIQAATAGHRAGEDDAHRDKAAYWAERGRHYNSTGLSSDPDEWVAKPLTQN